MSTDYSTPAGQGNGQSTADQAKDKAGEIAGQAREQVGQAAEQARGQMRSQVDERSTQAGQKVNSTASDLRSVADALRNEGKDQPAKLAEQAAERAQRVGSYLEGSDADRILRDIEAYARRQPWAVGLGAAALGFAGARFLKASSSQRYQQQHWSERTTGAGNGTTRGALPPAGATTSTGTGAGSMGGYGTGSTGYGTNPPGV